MPSKEPVYLIRCGETNARSGPHVVAEEGAPGGAHLPLQARAERAPFGSPDPRFARKDSALVCIQRHEQTTCTGQQLLRMVFVASITFADAGRQVGHAPARNMLFPSSIGSQATLPGSLRRPPEPACSPMGFLTACTVDGHGRGAATRCSAGMASPSTPRLRNDHLRHRPVAAASARTASDIRVRHPRSVPRIAAGEKLHDPEHIRADSFFTGLAHMCARIITSGMDQ